MRPVVVHLVMLGILSVGSHEASAQARPSVVVATIDARPADVSTIDGIIKAFYEVISGPAGQPRQWARDRTLYLPGMRFVPTSVRPSTGKPYARIVDHQQYVDGADEGMVKNGFFEREIHRVTQRVANTAHVMSTYEERQTAEGASTGRGVNSLHLFWDGARWWIAGAMWEDERPGSPIPKELLP